MLNKSLPWIGLLLLTACRTPIPASRPAPQTIWQASGPPAARITTVSKRLQSPLPSPLQDAFFWQKQLGDGEFGPSDFVEFGLLVVTATDLKRWQQPLTPLTPPPAYIAPQPMPPWWIAETDFAALDFYQLQGITWRSQGWMGIDRQTSKIYFYTYTN